MTDDENLEVFRKMIQMLKNASEDEIKEMRKVYYEEMNKEIPDKSKWNDFEIIFPTKLKNFEPLITKLKETYSDVNFEIIQEIGSIQLLYDAKKYAGDEGFFKNVCEISYNYLDDEEKNIFAILYDYFNEMSLL